MSRTQSATFSIESREVLAGAYLGPNKGRGSMLIHAVIVNGDKQTIEPLCDRVSVWSLADRNAGDWREPPTCPHCLRALKKRSASATKVAAADWKGRD